MRSRADRLALARAVVSCALLLVATAAPAQQESGGSEAPRARVYRWIDENGIAHYTTDPERIPSRLRSSVGLPRPGETPPAPRAAPSAPAPSGAAPTNPLAMDRAPGGSPGAPARSSAASNDFEEGPSAGAAASGAERADLDARIAALEAEIAADEEAIQAMISAAEPGPGALAADDPAFREIAQRLPKRLADLRALEQERARLGEP
jgi:hypothetical protein